MSLRDKLRAIAQGVTNQLVPVPEWAEMAGKEDYKIEVRRLTVAMQTIWRTLAADPSIKVPESDDDDDPATATIIRAELTERSMAALIVASSFDPETGERVFEDQDVLTLMGLTTEHKTVIDRLIGASVDLNAFGKEAPKEAENFSGTTPTTEPSSESGPKPASRRRR